MLFWQWTGDVPTYSCESRWNSNASWGRCPAVVERDTSRKMDYTNNSRAHSISGSILITTLCNKVSLSTLKLYQQQATLKANTRIPVSKLHTYFEMRVRNEAPLTLLFIPTVSNIVQPTEVPAVSSQPGASSAPCKACKGQLQICWRNR
jgi:hypothetical protein